MWVEMPEAQVDRRRHEVKENVELLPRRKQVGLMTSSTLAVGRNSTEDPLKPGSSQFSAEEMSA